MGMHASPTQAPYPEHAGPKHPYAKRLLEQLRMLHVPEGARILAACSGGLDSTVMAHLLVACKQPFALAHVNYGLRGEESDADEAFVRRLAVQLGVPVHVHRAERGKAAAAESGLGTQGWARGLRYDWFEELAAEYQYAAIATAHHLDDQAETLLLRLARGSGLRGMQGIAERKGHVVRPLLAFTRADLLSYAERQGIAYRHDTSNDADAYARNQVRHHAMPTLQAINHRAVHHLAETTHLATGALALLAHLVETQTAYTPENVAKGISLGDLAARWPSRISADWLAAQGPHLEPMLQTLLRRYGFTHAQITEMAEMVRQPGGAIWQGPQHSLCRHRKSLVLLRNDVDVIGTLTTSTSPALHLEAALSTHFATANNATEAYLDADAVGEHTQRSWAWGDTYRQLGAPGHRPLTERLMEARISEIERKRLPLLVAASQEIAWAPGLPPAEAFKVTDSTTHVLHATFSDGQPMP